jgi:hypothetical protein
MTAELRTTLLVGMALGLAGAASAWRGHSLRAAMLMSLSVLLSAAGMAMPVFACGFHRAWMRMARAAGRVNTRILLTLVYFFIFVPYRVLGRLAGRDPLGRRTRRESYWIARTRTRQERWQFERLY